MTRLGRTVAPVLSAFIIGACTEIAAPGPLHISVTTSRAVITPGDTTHITVTVRNISPSPVTVNLGCAIDVRILEVGDPTDVTDPGPRICIAIYAPVTLEPSETFEQTFLFDAMVGSCTGGTCYRDPFPAGDYVIKGVVFYEKGPAVSDPVPLEIR
jgi:hypothetical protein